MPTHLRKPHARHLERIGFAAMTTGAAVLGLVVAASLGVRHPWWAAMTVWLVAQPTRGLLLERAIARLAGTVAGAIAGKAMLAAFGDDEMLVLATLIAWVGLCAAGGSLFRHFRAYAFVLAGYSAAIVVLFALAVHDRAGDVAADRVSCTVIGILCSTVVAAGIAMKRDEETMRHRVDAVFARVLDRVEAYLRYGGADAPQPLLAAVATLYREADDLAAGSLRERRIARRVSRASGLLIELVALTVADRRTAAIETGDASPDRIDGLRALARREGQEAIATALDDLASVSGPLSFRHRWRWFWATVSPGRARRAALRPMTALAVASMIWLATDWRDGAMMAVAATLFSSLFSSHAQGNKSLSYALGGSLAGAMVGVGYRLFLLPGAESVIAVALCLVPVLAIGAWLMRHPATAKAAIDLNMSFLLTAQPLTPPPSTMATLSVCASIVAGVAIAAATFWFVLPADVATSSRYLRRRVIRQAVALRTARHTANALHARHALCAAILRLVEIDPSHVPKSLAVFGRYIRRYGGHNE